MTDDELISPAQQTLDERASHEDRRQKNRKVQRARADESVTGSEAHQEFIRSLHAKVEHKLASPVDEEIQIEISNLMRLLASMSWKTISQNRVYFEWAFDLLAADKPNMIVIRGIRFDLGGIRDRSGGRLSRTLTFLSGDSPLHAVLSGMFFVLVLSFAIVYFMAEAHHMASMAINGAVDPLPLFKAIPEMPINQLMLLIHAAFLGGIVSILVRLKDFLSIAEFSSLLVFVSVVTRPFISVMFALLAFVMMKSGLVSFLGVDMDGKQGPYIAWALGFICGFSERFAREMIARTGSTFGASSSLEAKRPR